MVFITDPLLIMKIHFYLLYILFLTFIYRIFGNFVLRATAAVKLFSEIICVYVHFYEWLLISLFEKNVINII